MPLARSPRTQPSSVAKPQGSRRGDYVSQACLNCRKRKIKCSGGNKCSECEKNDEQCVYGERRRKQRVDKRRHVESHRTPDMAAVEPEDGSVLIDMTSRLSSLEDQCTRLRATLDASCNRNHQTNALSRLSPRRIGPIDFSFQEQQQSMTVDTSQLEAVAADTAPPQQSSPQDTYQDVAIDESGSNFNHVESLPSNHQIQQHQGVTTDVDHQLLAAPIQFDNSTSDTRAILQEIRQNNGAAYRRTFDLFFRSLNPLHPILNENEFLLDFENLVFYDSDAILTSERALLLALVCFIRAEVAILDQTSAESSNVPGWADFCIAQALLQDLLWKGVNDIKTLQCLCLKSRYLMYLDQPYLAYDTVASAFRICLLINLHDETRWDDTDAFGSVMRARLFWCLFTLDHAVAMNCGLPSHTSRIEYNVKLPDFLDDRSLFPGRPLPGPTIELSSIPYLHKVVAWAKICESLESRLYGLTRPCLLSEQDVLELDNCIMETLVDVPCSANGGLNLVNSFRHYSQESLMLLYRVRMNSLRLLIRQDSMSTSMTEPISAQTILDIVGESIHIIKSCVWGQTDNVGRYVATAGFSHLLTPLSYMIFIMDRRSNLWSRATELWNEALDGIKQISFGFDLARRTLYKFKSLIQITENMGANQPAQPELGSSSSIREALPTEEHESLQNSNPQGHESLRALAAQYQGTTHDFSTVAPLQMFVFSANDVPNVVSW